MAAPRRRRTTKSPALRARYAKRRKNRLAKVANDLTPGQWEALLSAWGEACAYCGDAESALQKDCVQPVSRHGRYTSCRPAGRATHPRATTR